MRSNAGCIAKAKTVVASHERDVKGLQSRFQEKTVDGSSERCDWDRRTIHTASSHETIHNQNDPEPLFVSIDLSASAIVVIWRMVSTSFGWMIR